MDKQKILKKIRLFKGLTGNEITAVARLCRERKYRADEVILVEGSRGEEIYILKKGKIRIDFEVTGESDQVTVHRITEGQIFGELALVDKGLRSATAQCESDCEVITISREQLYDFFETHHRVGYLVMKNIAKEMSKKLRRAKLQLIASITWK
ncbi:MAG: cyclic nucleotide-binding domain-containing protein [Desulfobacterales bacterium]|nr:MAG: cyclic nucleotide-binding domain-containing protein [Desulfobacterales bacterium]